MHGGDWAAGGEFRILAENSGVATTLSTISANTDDFWHLLELDIPAPSPFVLTNVSWFGVHNKIAAVFILILFTWY